MADYVYTLQARDMRAGKFECIDYQESETHEEYLDFWARTHKRFRDFQKDGYDYLIAQWEDLYEGEVVKEIVWTPTGLRAS